jgi:hypothetical protein
MLGLRFKVLILAPAIVIGSVATLGIGTMHNSSLWSILLSMVLAITALQMGYLSGTVIRFLIAGAQIRETSPAIIAGSQRPAHRTHTSARPDSVAERPA